MSEDLNLALYSFLTKTRRGSLPKRVVSVVTGQEFEAEGVPRFEYFRGVPGEVVYDLTRFRGIVSHDEESVTVRAGTTWKEVLDKFPDVATFSVLEFSVGGSVYFDDPIFGFNEYKSIRSQVRVKAFSQGKVEEGPYNGGIPIEITLKRSKDELVHYKSDLGSASQFMATIVDWAPLPHLFRDITFVKKGKEFSLYVSYPTFRADLVARRLASLPGIEERDTPFFESVGSYKRIYWYYGTLQASELGLLNQFVNLDNVDMVVRLGRRGTVVLSLYSDSPLNLPPELVLLSFSDMPNKEAFTSPCIMCGKCVEVCPHVRLKGGVSFSPLGFYALRPFYDVKEIATCSYCGACEAVCPVNLPILKDFAPFATFVEVKGPGISSSETSEEVLLVTDISSSLEEEVKLALVFLRSKGVNVKPYYYSKPLKDLLLRKVEENVVEKDLSFAKKIYVVTPEEYRVLKNYLKDKEVILVQELALNDLKGSYKVHRGCYYDLRTDNCSYAFLDLMSGRKTEKKLDFNVSLCPFTANKLNITTPLRLLLGSKITKYQGKISPIIEMYRNLIKKYKEELEWYEGLDDDAVRVIKENVMIQAIKASNVEDVAELIGVLEGYTTLDEETKLLLEALKKITKT